jgi:hypothetical protein
LTRDGLETGWERCAVERANRCLSNRVIH